MPEFNESVTLTNRSNDTTVHLDEVNASLRLGAQGQRGALYIRTANNEDSVHVDGATGHLRLGGNVSGVNGIIVLRDANNLNTAHLDGQNASLRLGTQGQRGALYIRGANNTDTAHIDGATGHLRLGGSNSRINGILTVRDAADNPSIRLDGQTGDIVLANADCAEEFDIIEGVDVEPGTVMVMTSDDELQPCESEFDRRVAGVISGAGTYKPGLVLDKKISDRKRLPVALMGKVWCKVDATFGAVEVGDLLSTSSTIGYARKATDPISAFGAVIGKALKPLSGGKGMIPILVALQ